MLVEVAECAGNPAAAREDYFLYAVFRLRRLCVLDGEPVSAAQQAAARSRFAGRLTLEFLEERAPGTVWSSCAPFAVPCSPPVSDSYPQNDTTMFTLQHTLFDWISEFLHSFSSKWSFSHPSEDVVQRGGP